MTEPVTVNLNIPSYYEEPDNGLYRFKRRLTFRKIISIIRKSVKNRETFSLLEIGCGSGYFLSFLEEMFPGASLTGIEYDPRLIPVIRGRIKSATVINDNAEDFDPGNRMFDVIVSLQVIEHLHKPEDHPPVYMSLHKAGHPGSLDTPFQILRRLKEIEGENTLLLRRLEAKLHTLLITESR